MQPDPRFILLAESGECLATLGRSAPTADDLTAASNSMKAAGVAGWVAIASHSFHARNKPILTMATPINAPGVLFATAAAIRGRVVPQSAKELVL